MFCACVQRDLSLFNIISIDEINLLARDHDLKEHVDDPNYEDHARDANVG